MSPITVADALSPMPAASYIRPHDKSKTRKLSVPAARVGELLRQAPKPCGPHREEPRHVGSPGSGDNRPSADTRPQGRFAGGATPRSADLLREYEPGLHTGLNGERIYATDREIHYLDENPVRIESNGVLSRRIVGGSQSAKSEFEMFDAAYDDGGRTCRQRTATTRLWTPT